MSAPLAVFTRGRIGQVGPPAEVYERPANAFVAGFVGVSNVLERGGRRLTVGPEKIRLPLHDDGADDRVVVVAVAVEGPSFTCDAVPLHISRGSRGTLGRST